MGIYMKHKRVTRQYLITFIFAVIIIITAIFRTSQRIDHDVASEMRNTLRDVASQNAVIVQLEIRDKFDLLNSIASEVDPTSFEDLTSIKQYQSFVDTYQFKRIGFVAQNGQVITTDGYTQDLSEREFYHQGMKGISVVTTTLDDHIGSSEPINVFSVPVYDSDNTICGVLFATYRTKQFQDILSVESFNGKGFSCIVSQNGDLFACSSNAPEFLQNTDNLLTHLSEREQENTVSYQHLHDLLFGKTDGSGAFSGDDYRYFYHAVPIDDDRTDTQWFIFTIAPESVLISRTNNILSHVRILTFILLLVLICGLLIYVYSIHSKHQQLQTLAYTDSLTGAGNYALFKEKMKEQSKRHGFYVALDLQDFKLINSTCGIEKGDETLQAVSKLLQSHLKKEEFFARIDADRFLIIFWDKDKAALELRLQMLCQDLDSLSEELNIPRIFPLIGIYETSDHHEVEQNYGKAVQAKYIVKGNRSRHYAFYDELNIDQILENKQIEDNFENAIKNGEFRIWYQPKVDPQTARILGAEALIRWERPDGSLFSPAKFIPLFERDGNITALDEYVFRAVCTQQQKWQDSGFPMFPISVNISRVSLYFSNIVEKYRSILDSYHLDPKYVPLEITESATIDNNDIASLIDQFHEAGFTLLLDDFGSGYSSLSSLNEMHFDTIKLDKSLIDYIGDPNGEKLLQQITLLLQNLGMSITAEGVETASQVKFLESLHCDDIQGYYFSKPLPVDDYEKFALTHR